MRGTPLSKEERALQAAHQRGLEKLRAEAEARAEVERYRVAESRTPTVIALGAPNTLPWAEINIGTHHTGAVVWGSSQADADARARFIVRCVEQARARGLKA